MPRCSFLFCLFFFLLLLFLKLFLFLSILWASWICGLVSDIYWENSVITVSNTSSSFTLPSLSDIPIAHILHILKLSHSSWIFCSIFLFSDYCLSNEISSNTEILSSAVSSSLISPSKAVFIPFTAFLISNTPFWFFFFYLFFFFLL